MKIIASFIVAIAIAIACLETVSAFQLKPNIYSKQPTNSPHQLLLSTPTTQLSATTSVNDDTEYDLLGLPARPGRPLSVAIAGGGVGGLTAALCMLKKVRLFAFQKSTWFHEVTNE